tara:strand:- start:35 stop:1228 length:1194 start_codon:yes stop_codon:yes gene_type:complete
MKNKKVLHIKPTHSVAIKEQIVELGYNDPWSDSDLRIKKMFDLIFSEGVNLGFGVEVLKSIGLGNLARCTESNEQYFKQLQMRMEKTGTEEGLQELYEEIYVRRKRRERIPIVVEIDGEIYGVAGWKRLAMHKMAIEDYQHQSLCDVLLLTPPEDFDSKPYKYMSFLKKLADFSNDRSQSQTRDMVRKDYINALDGQRLLDIEDPEHWMKSDTSNFEETELREYGRKYLINNHSYYASESELSIIVNGVFSKNHSFALDKPCANEIEKIHSKFFEDTWSTEMIESTYCKVVAETRLKRGAFAPLNESGWSKRETHSAVRDEITIFVTFEPNLTTLSEHKEKKEKALENITEYNKNKNFKACGCSLCDRIIFHKHFANNKVSNEAYQWNKRQSKFLKK